MNELIQINQSQINNETVQTVNARDLHVFLGIKRQFGNWITERIEQYGFVENVDFTINKFVIRNNLQKDYHVALDMAKELAMVERNDKGKQARQYFIECERKSKQAHAFAIPKSFKEALLLAADQQDVIDKQQAVINVQAPKAAYYDNLKSEDGESFEVVAKEFGTGRNRLFELLRENGILQANNSPYQKYAHYFKLKEAVFTKPSGEQGIKFTPLIKSSGKKYIYDRFFKQSVTVPEVAYAA